jgi:hypothetical protein
MPFGPWAGHIVNALKRCAGRHCVNKEMMQDMGIGKAQCMPLWPRGPGDERVRAHEQIVALKEN